jgi:hypothetical protein
MSFGKLFTEGLASSGASGLIGTITGGISQALGLSRSFLRFLLYLSGLLSM